MLSFLPSLLALVWYIDVVKGYCHRSRWGTVSCCGKPKFLTDNGLGGGERRIGARSVSNIASLLSEGSPVLDSATSHHDPWQSYIGPTLPSTVEERLQGTTSCETIHHVKKRFESSYTVAIAPHYRTYILDLLAFTHIQRQQAHFQYDAVYALGLCTQFYSAMRHYALPQEVGKLMNDIASLPTVTVCVLITLPYLQIDAIFNAMVIALQMDPQQVRDDAKRLISLTKGHTSSSIDQLPPAELFTVVNTGPAHKEFPLTDAWAVGLGRLIELCGAIPSETTFRRWNRRGMNNARLMAAWSDFQADSQRLFSLECIQQQLLQSSATYWPSKQHCVSPRALFQKERLQALQQMNANMSVNR